MDHVAQNFEGVKNKITNECMTSGDTRCWLSALTNFDHGFLLCLSNEKVDNFLCLDVPSKGRFVYLFIKHLFEALPKKQAFISSDI